jgi:alpha-tubulin suppressor-like RCC1 family protein
VWCWGANSHGECGTGSGLDSQPTPGLVTLPFSAAHVAAGGSATCALSADGKLACWGNDGSSSSKPLAYTSAALQSVKKVSPIGGPFTSYESLALSTPNGAVEDFLVSVLGQPTPTNPFVGATDIAAGGKHTCVLDTAGVVRCWGDNSVGELGLGMTGSSVTMPQPINGLSATAIATGFDHSCAITSTGAVVCWGSNTFKQSGGTTNPVTSPQAVPIFGSPPITALVLGNSDSGVIAQGQLYLWGYNVDNQVSPSGVDEPAPTLVAGLAGIVGAALGSSHTCALLDTGVVKCWGANGNYQLGDGTQNPSPTPVDVKWK